MARVILIAGILFTLYFGIGTALYVIQPHSLGGYPKPLPNAGRALYLTDLGKILIVPALFWLYLGEDGWVIIAVSFVVVTLGGLKWYEWQRNRQPSTSGD